MNFEYLQTLISNTEFDEIKVIGQDIKKDNRCYHIIGMTLKDKKATLHVLELSDGLSEEEQVFKVEIPRASLKKSMEEQRNQSFFMHIREFQNGKNVYETAGATGSSLRYSNYAEAYLLFFKMMNAGWKVSETSPFYDVSWELCTLTQIEFREEFEHLPEWTKDMQVLVDSVPESYPIELPVVLKCGESKEVHFLLADKKEAVCYINNVYLIDMWEEEEKRFSDPVYKERMLQHISEAEFEEMKEQFFQILEESCPKGKCYVGIEYECTEADINLKFYDRAYLDQKPEAKGGSASALLMQLKPDSEIGAHGLKLYGDVIQKPLEKETEEIEAELFSYSKRIQQRKMSI